VQASRFSFAFPQSDNDNISIKNIIESCLSIESKEYFNLAKNKRFQQVFSNNMKTLSRNNSASQLDISKENYQTFKNTNFFD